jgi:hypothetical protein
MLEQAVIMIDLFRDNDISISTINGEAVAAGRTGGLPEVCG